MGGLGIWEILVILVIILVIFGAGKLPKVMGDLGKGIRSFKSGLKDATAEEEEPPPAPRTPITTEQAVNAAPAPIVTADDKTKA